LTCSDSRVPPEVIFGQGLGLLFVVRVAGNVIDTAVLGSIEYAVVHLKTPLLVIMGHEKCGAVIAAAGATQFEGGIGGLLKLLQPSIKRSTEVAGANWWTQKDSDVQAYNTALDKAVRVNVITSKDNLVHSSNAVRELVNAKKLKIVTAVYHLQSGEVSQVEDMFFKEDPLSHSGHHHHHHTTTKKT